MARLYTLLITRKPRSIAVATLLITRKPRLAPPLRSVPIPIVSAAAARRKEWRGKEQEMELSESYDKDSGTSSKSCIELGQVKESVHKLGAQHGRFTNSAPTGERDVPSSPTPTAASFGHSLPNTSVHCSPPAYPDGDCPPSSSTELHHGETCASPPRATAASPTSATSLARGPAPSASSPPTPARTRSLRQIYAETVPLPSSSPTVSPESQATCGSTRAFCITHFTLYTTDTATGVRRVCYGATQFDLDAIFTGSRQVVYPGEGGGSLNVRTCHNTLGGKNVHGAIVLCWRNPTVAPFLQAETVRKAGGEAMVLMNDQMTGEELDNVPYLHIFSVVIKHSNALDIVQRYNFKKIGAVTARFWPSKSLFNIRPCPVVAGFSSRGPSAETTGFLKPDILGPGVSILGAKSGTTDKFVTESGTSFATPHLAAIAALLKSRHPDWSPAAIRSAIMTTADIEDIHGNRITNHTGKIASFYDAGAGLVNPARADDPGLVYNITDTKDYVRVLCSLYTQAEVNKFARPGRIVDCAALGKLKPEDLNYPSIAMTLSGSGKNNVDRTVTNVGPATSTYNCLVEGVPMTQVRVSVKPCQLTFTNQIKEASFMVEAELAPRSTLPSGKVVEGFLKWTSTQGGHVVRSPLALIVRRLATSSHVFFLPAILSFLVSRLILHSTAGQLHLPLDRETGDHHDMEYDRDIPRLYIVHLLPPQHRLLSSPEEVEAWYRSFLPTLVLDSGKPRMVHSYTKAISGFAAWLTPREVENMREMEGFVGARLDEPLELATSHTPKFLQLENGTGLWQQTKWGDGRLIGVVDWNIDPDHVSFAGEGMQPSPEWKGTCEFQCDYPTNCFCTNKLLGAAIFNKPRGEEDAHGTMVASIAAGDFVSGVADVTFTDYATGIASGASPKSYLSFYNSKSTSGFVAAIDRAIADGVNVLCISLSVNIHDYPDNYMAIATLAAVEHGIFVAMAAGNYGPGPGTIRNDAPWLLTVGASTHDRAPEMEFVVVDNSMQESPFYGVTQYQPSLFPTAPKPLLYPGEGRRSHAVRTCHNNLGGKDATGAIVLCWRDPAVPPFEQAETVKNAGGIALVLMNDKITWDDDLSVVPYLHIPTVVMTHSDSNIIVQTYVNSKKMGPVTARFWPSNSRFNIRPCPVVYDKSSRGPNRVSESILKPDILGPGVNILGAKAGTTDKFRTGTGTSYATPHLAAVAALLKSLHPGWSPAAIRSAIMTTANITDTDGNYTTDHTGKTASFYAAGAGLVNPQRADDPGLIYDITDTTDYLRVLCRLYQQDEVNKFARMGRIVDCATLGRLDPEQLNYPSIAMTLRRRGKKVVHRTVTNVGPPTSDYNCLVELPMTEVQVSIRPRRLAFTRRREQLSFTVEAKLMPRAAAPSGTVIEGYLKWTSVQGRRVVRSPLALIVP
ncbi:hypothetical protein Taro_031449 [Colocasia esculenta]|uniref:Uncharacterized protein n=1 Tax=Colocasia esculenta TaxID=4460 RepID=A0A843W0Y1_COLES|nr:hypothetical protein [Colocasia esculenta]